MVKKIFVEFDDDELWDKIVKKAIKKFGIRGYLKKTVKEALEKWLKED
ncbi:MAG: hypothetical protein QXQ18_01820 [Candidatus Aenigmatarchaeota archaeon]